MKDWPKEQITKELLDIFREAFGRIKALTKAHIGGRSILSWMPSCNVVFRLRKTLALEVCNNIGGENPFFAAG